MDTVVSYTSDRVQVWEARSTAILAQFITPPTYTRGVALPAHYLLVADQQKPLLHYYKFGREESVRKSAVADPVVTLVQSGAFTIGGGERGSLYVWFTETGELVGFVAAHFGAITCLSALGDVVVSGGSDGTVMVWMVSRLVCGESRPFQTFREHTLPITALAIESPVSVITSSED
jgi:WD40 repeat protein